MALKPAEKKDLTSLLQRLFQLFGLRQVHRGQPSLVQHKIRHT
jgi:hypothetical protein